MLSILNKLKVVIKKYPPLYRVVRNSYTILGGFKGLLKRQRGAKDYFLSTISLSQHSSYVAGKPMNITIEPTNICNLHCPVCETGAGILQRPKRNMSFEEFRIIIDKIAFHTNILMFYFMGEPFLNKDAYRMIRYAKNKGIPFITTCTNGDFVKPEELVNSGIDEISFQIGGMTQETHNTYRVGSRLDRVLENLKETVRLRNQMRSAMSILCGFILMRHNEHEIEEFKSAMTQIGVDEAVVVDPCVRTIEQAKEMLPTDEKHWYYDPVALGKGELKPRVIPQDECPWIYYSMTVQVNGDVVPCCRDVNGENVMGNLYVQSLEDIWNEERFINFRSKLLKKQSEIGICRLCSGYGVSQIK